MTVVAFPSRPVPSIAALYANLTKSIGRIQAETPGDPDQAARLILRAALLNARMHCTDARLVEALAMLSWEIEP